MKETVDIEVKKRKLTLEIEGITQFEVAAIAREVEERMLVLEKKYEIADSSKLAIILAVDYAVELHRLREADDLARDTAERKLEELSLALKTAVDSAAR